MSYFHFDDISIKKEYRKIARTGGKSKKIDSNFEKEQLAQYLSGAKSKMSRNDEALLKSTSLNFENRQVKRKFKSIAGYNGNKKIDTEEEYVALKKYLDENGDNISTADKTLIINMLNAYTPDVNIKIEGDNNIVNTGDINVCFKGDVTVKGSLAIGVGNTQNSDESGISSNIEENSTEENISENIAEDKNDLSEPVLVQNEHKTTDVIIKQGDYWYKLIRDNYNVVSNDETMKLVRYFKQEYYEQNKDKLIRQGHVSSKSNFFYSVDEVAKLPQNVEIDGTSYSLKNN